MTGSGIRRGLLRHPVRLVPLGLLAAILVATALLMLPAARAGPEPASFFTALFTATSAVCTTGLVVTETASYWTTLGHVIIMLLTQLGGFGIITAALLTALLVSQRIGLSGRQVFAESTRLNVDHAPALLIRIGLTMLSVEGGIAAILAARLTISYDYPPGRAVWYGVFHAVQAFNNSGFALFKESGATGFVTDAWVGLPLTLGVIIGSLGFPVIFELWRHWRRPARWSIHTRLTVWGSLILLAAGTLAVIYFERDNAATLGPLTPATKVLAAFVQAAIPRSGGLQTVDYGAMHEETIASTTILMFIGGGSASTAGGIKVTTFFLLAFVIWTELRGEQDVVIARRRIAEVTQRRALTIALLSVALVTVATLVLVAETTGLRLHRVLFEAMSAFSTAGLSVGITQQLPVAGQVVLVILMFIGRLGTIVAASALALHSRRRHYGYPEEQPIVG